MSRRALLVAVAAAVGLVALAAVVGARTHDSPDVAEHADHDGGTDDADATADQTADTDRTCEAELAELDRRDEAGEIDWAAIEGDDEEPTDEELAAVIIERDPYPGDVAAGEERPTFPDFPDRLDIAALTDEELAWAVDTCYEIGVLTDGDDEEAG